MELQIELPEDTQSYVTIALLIVIVLSSYFGWADLVNVCIGILLAKYGIESVYKVLKHIR